MKKVSLILFVSILMASCSKGDVMDRTIFLPDADDDSLPAYTEWGYNTFGAKYDRAYFLASYYIVPCKIVYKDNHLHFYLSGVIRYQEEITLAIIFPLAQMSDYKDLMQLNNKKIDLADNNCTIKIIQNGKDDLILEDKKGELYFKRTQLLSIDDAVNRVILSGFFEINFLKNGMPTRMSSGRFDLGITNGVVYISN